MGMMMIFAQLFQIKIEPNLGAKSERKRDDVQPEFGELGYGEAPTRNQSEHAEINPQ